MEHKEEMITALDSFLNDSLILPPGDIDNKELFTLEAILKATNRFKRQGQSVADTRDLAKGDYMFN